MTLRASLFLLIAVILLGCSTPPKSIEHKPQVILKLDDLGYEEGLVHPGWQKVVDFLNEEKVIGTIGLIGDSFLEGDSAYFQWIKDRHEEGYEIWNHGFCHCKPMVDSVEHREFRGMSFGYQLNQVQQTQQLAKEKVGITLTSFGAPYNSTDSATAAALAQIPELTIWMYKETTFPTEKTILPRIPEVNIEYPVHVPDVDQFKAGYAQFKSEPVLIIQGHPRSWTEDSIRWDNFTAIVHFLKSEGVTFTTPQAYVRGMK
ncbi:MAG: polysaccharide deacetylase family protein [Bacteroidia bacterium]|nr:polysaccharide deacetylase family protein [Bacteroidia bacterium]